MPWFITAIAEIEPDRAERGFRVPHHTRTFGFYDKYSDALDAVLENRCNMHECLYMYLVVEHIEQGIHPEVKNTVWWVWKDDGETRGWKPYYDETNTSSCPPQFMGIINWALG